MLSIHCSLAILRTTSSGQPVHVAEVASAVYSVQRAGADAALTELDGGAGAVGAPGADGGAGSVTPGSFDRSRGTSSDADLGPGSGLCATPSTVRACLT